MAQIDPNLKLRVDGEPAAADEEDEGVPRYRPLALAGQVNFKVLIYQSYFSSPIVLIYLIFFVVRLESNHRSRLNLVLGKSNMGTPRLRIHPTLTRV